MYLVDANVLIQAKNQHYAFDIVPAFWDWLKKTHRAGRVFTVQSVYDEVLARNDDLSDWIQALPSSFSLAPQSTDQASLSTLSGWANSSRRYTQGAVAAFLSAGDYFLVAQAHSLQYIVVTHETASPDSKKRIKIPEACAALDVKWMTPFKMLRSEGACFSLQ